MSERNRFCRLAAVLIVIALSLPLTFAQGQTRSAVSKDVEDQHERAQEAAQILNELTRTPEKGIPRELLEDAQGIAVFPNVVKAAFGIGGQRGKGLIAVRQGSGWGAPAFVELTGGSFGFQIGAEATDLVLVFRTRDGVNSLMNSKLKLGADASIAAGPVGRTAGAGTDLAMNAQILSYSRTKGAFVGVSLEGAVVDFDDSANEDVYGMKGKQVLAGKASASPVTAPFMAALRQHTPSGTRRTQ